MWMCTMYDCTCCMNSIQIHMYVSHLPGSGCIILYGLKFSGGTVSCCTSPNISFKLSSSSFYVKSENGANESLCMEWMVNCGN